MLANFTDKPYKIKAFVADLNPQGLNGISASINKDDDQRIWTAEVDVAD